MRAVCRQAGGEVKRPATLPDPALVLPINRQEKLTWQIAGYLGQGDNVTVLTFTGVAHTRSAQNLFYIDAAREWLLAQAMKQPQDVVKAPNSPASLVP